MGNFGGHALPGSFFVCFAIWWTINIFKRYYTSLLKNGSVYQNTVTFPCTCLCGRLKNWEIEGFVKIFFTTIGFTLEIITAYHDGKFTYLGNGQHATMFFFFGLSGLVDILVHQNLPLPKGIEYIMSAIAFTVEGILFKFHLHGRTDLDVLIHTLLLYAIIANVAAVFIEMKFRKSVLAALARAFFVFLQGTWFWQVGFILYNPIPDSKPWDGGDHEEMMIATMMFTWHMGGIVIFMLLTGGIIGFFYRLKYGQFEHFRSNYDQLNMHLIHKDSNGHTVINLNHDNDSESDIEFERPIMRSSGGLS